MWTVRAVRIEDLDALAALVKSATRGLTSLQLDRARLLDRVEQSVFAFSRSGESRYGEPYVLVLVDDETGELVGTSTIYARTGGHEPFYAYRIVPSDHYSQMLALRCHRVRLELERIHDGPTEIGSLFLRGTYRGAGRGRWLSLARFALIAMLPSRFGNRVIAEMRGKANPDGSVPFWDAVSGRFIPTDFATVDTMSTVSKQFIDELMPQHPIYLDLLSDDVRQGIGQVHAESRPALQMLKAEGFTETDLVDIFDAGPVIRCETKKINAVARTQRVTVRQVVDRIDSSAVDSRPEKFIVASFAAGFTSVLDDVVKHGGEVTLTSVAAEAIGVGQGQTCFVLPLHPQERM
jgi:arginine N-succinyltransferase